MQNVGFREQEKQMDGLRALLLAVLCIGLPMTHPPASHFTQAYLFPIIMYAGILQYMIGIGIAMSHGLPSWSTIFDRK